MGRRQAAGGEERGGDGSLGEQRRLTPQGEQELSRVLTTVHFHVAGSRKRHGGWVLDIFQD